MEKEIILQIPAYQSYVNGAPTNAGVNKISNSEWEVSLKQTVIINNGDAISMRNVFLDTRQTNSNAVIIEQDTVLELEHYFYQMLPPDMWSDDLVVNTPDAWKYTVFGAAYDIIMDVRNELGIAVMTPNHGYYNNGTPPTSGTPSNDSGTNQTLSFEIPMILRENKLDGGAPITKTWKYVLKAGTYQYDDLALILTRAMSSIPNPLSATNAMASTSGNAFICGELGKNYIDGNSTNPSIESYTTSYNGKQGVFTEFLSNINVPTSLLNPTYNGAGVSFTNPFTIATGGKMLLAAAGATYANRTVFANQVVGSTEVAVTFNDQASKFQFQYSHTPVQSAANVIEPIASNPPSSITTSAGAPIESVMLCGSINNINEQPINQQQAASYDQDGNNPPNLIQGTLYQITQLGFIVDIVDGGNTNPNIDWSPIGGSETASVGDQFTMSDATGGFPQSIGPFQIYGCFVIAVNPTQPSLTQNLCRYTKHSGIMFKRMEPVSFWQDILGFDVPKLLVTDNELLNRNMTFLRFKNITTEGFMGQTDNFDFGYPTPIYPIKTPAPDFYSYLPLGKSSGVAADISVQQVLAMTEAVAVYSDTNVQPFYPWTFTSIATIPIEANAFAVGSKDTSGHSLIELTLGYQNQLVNNSNTYQVKGVVSNYYTSSGSFSTAPFPDSYVYQHYGEPIQLSSIKIRALDPITMTNLAGLGPNSCVYLQVTKPITDVDTTDVSA